MGEADDGPLARWSRRKRDGRARDGAGGKTAERAAAPTAPPGDQTESRPATEGDIVERLPDIDSLDETSDFSAFLQEGVPEAIRRKALRRLWRLNPVFANLDGLNDYDEDFTDAATVVEGLKTLYKVGKGMLGEEEEDREAGADETPVEPADRPQAKATEDERASAGSADTGSDETERSPRPRAPDRPSAAGQDEHVTGSGHAAKRSARERRWGRTSS